MTEHLLKILIVGDGNVGKSSFVHRYVSGQFTRTYRMTVGGRLMKLRPLRLCYIVTAPGAQTRLSNKSSYSRNFGSSFRRKCYFRFYWGGSFRH